MRATRTTSPPATSDNRSPSDRSANRSRHAVSFEAHHARRRSGVARVAHRMAASAAARVFRRQVFARRQSGKTTVTQTAGHRPVSARATPQHLRAPRARRPRSPQRRAVEALETLRLIGPDVGAQTKQMLGIAHGERLRSHAARDATTTFASRSDGGGPRQSLEITGTIASPHEQSAA